MTITILPNRAARERPSGRAPSAPSGGQTCGAVRGGAERPAARRAVERSSSRRDVPLSLEDCGAAYRARQLLECTAIDILSGQRAALAPLRETLEAAQDHGRLRAARSGNPGLSRFHLQLVEMTGNRGIIRCYRALLERLSRYEDVFSLLQEGVRACSEDEHGSILSLLEQGEYERAKARLAEHLDKAKRSLWATMLGAGPAGDI